jgi:hypothetical protein
MLDGKHGSAYSGFHRTRGAADSGEAGSVTASNRQGRPNGEAAATRSLPLIHGAETMTTYYKNYVAREVADAEKAYANALETLREQVARSQQYLAKYNELDSLRLNVAAYASAVVEAAARVKLAREMHVELQAELRLSETK